MTGETRRPGTQRSTCHPAQGSEVEPRILAAAGQQGERSDSIDEAHVGPAIEHAAQTRHGLRQQAVRRTAASGRLLSAACP